MTARPLPGTTGLIDIHCGSQRTSLSQLHILSRRATSDTLSTQLRSDHGGLSVSLLAGCQQARYFKKANYVEKIGDNERTEELLESLEDKHSERKAGSSRHVLDKDGKRPSTEGQDKKWSEDMTKGKPMMGSRKSSRIIANLNRETVDNTIPTIQAYHPFDNGRQPR
jgi:hypothetical protein